MAKDPWHQAHHARQAIPERVAKLGGVILEFILRT
jgi:hypothetical protein